MEDMTRGEAIERIKDHMIVHKMNEPRAIFISEALDLAISDMKKIGKYEQAIEKMLAAIDTPNRGTCDYYIVDQIENIINILRKEVL